MSHPLHQEEHANKLSAGPDGLPTQPLLAGDQPSFEALVNEYEKPLRGYIWRILKDEELVADVLQQVFLQLYLSLPKLNGHRSLKAWLFRVSYHRCLDELRQKKRRRFVFFSQLEEEGSEEVLFAETIQDVQPTPDDILEQQELHDRFVQILSMLPPTTRAIVYLRSFGELTFSEIGKHLNIPATTAKTYFHRSLPRLRAAFHCVRKTER